MTGLILLAVYIAIFAVSMVIVAWATKQFFTRADFTSLKTVTFGDESAVNAKPGCFCDLGSGNFCVVGGFYQFILAIVQGERPV
jgi:hypothetical protein